MSVAVSGTANGGNGATCNLDLSNCANGGNGGVAINGGVANGQDGTSTGNGNNGGIALGQGSNANNGGIAVNGGITHTGCNVAIGTKCFNVPGR
jgi:hypothetical protein